MIKGGNKMKLIYKNTEYIVINKAYSVNDGEYYVCIEIEDPNEWRLIPADSDEVCVSL